MSAAHERDGGGRERDGGGHAHLSHLPDGARPAVFAARAVVAFPAPATGGKLEDVVRRFGTALSGGLAAAGCTLVGHIKGVLAEPGHGDLAFHQTRLDATPALTGGLAGVLETAELTLNVIVFGVDEGELPAIVRDAWARASASHTTWAT